MVTHIIDFSNASSGSAISNSTGSTSNPLNPLNGRLRQYIYTELQNAIQSSSSSSSSSMNNHTNHHDNITSVILYGGGGGNGTTTTKSNFSAGADITEFESFLKTSCSSGGGGGKSYTSSSSSSGISTKSVGHHHHHHHGRDFSTPKAQESSPPSLLDIVHCIDTSPIPIIACINGICFGGGLELALACHYRIATTTTSTQLALPEIHVGVIPGAGGTQRLPRMIGLTKALSMMLTGQSISASDAYSLKLVDALVTVHDAKTTSDTVSNNKNTTLLDVGRQWAKFAEDIPLDSRRISLWNRIPDCTTPAQAHVMCHLAALSIPQQPVSSSQAAIIEACRYCAVSATSTTTSTTTTAFQDGMEKESQLFQQVLQSVEGKARRHAFFAVRTAQKIQTPTTTRRSIQPSPSSVHRLLMDPKTTKTPIEVAVIGAGTMGSGIAIVFLKAGYTVYLVDNSDVSLQRGIAMIHKVVGIQPTSMKQQQQQQLKFIPTKDLQQIRHCSLVIEAVIEQMEVKQQLFRQLDAIFNASQNHSVIMTSNTSTLDIHEMASVFETTTTSQQQQQQRQSQFAGLHFFSPAHIMKLVEIIRNDDPASATSSSSLSSTTISILQSVTKRIGKIGVVVGNCDGFCGNRMLRPYSAETVLLLVEQHQDGTTMNNHSTTTVPPTIEQVDYAIRNVFGMALGPFEMSDLAGNDIGYNIRKERGWVRQNGSETAIPTKRPSRYTELADDMVSQLHRNGQKASKGWYDYDPKIGKGRKPLPSIEMSNFVQRYIVQPSSLQQWNVKSDATTATTLSDQEIIERVLYPLVNEGFKCLEEQIVYQPSDIDVIYIYGYGFPIITGGPMYWADHIVTLPKLLRQLQIFHSRYPTTDHYVPSQLLLDCVQHNMTLQEYWTNKSKQQRRFTNDNRKSNL